MAAAQVLIIDDEPDIRESVREILEDEGYRVITAENAASARSVLGSARPDLILLDVWMPETDGIRLLKEWREQGGLPAPVVMISGHGTVETAVEATRLGAYDFIEKPISLAKLLITVERALEASRLRAENDGLRRQMLPVEPFGASAVMQQLLSAVRRVAGHDTWVLLRGEAGTGKATLARHIHAESGRRSGPFVPLAPGTIAREGLSTTLFGSEEGGQALPGLLEQASGGVLFIDEVTELDPELQLRLSAALERGSFQRVGGRNPVPLDVRVIAASSRDLEAEVAAGRFREEFYYQLNVVPLQVPPLRERPDDIAPLVAFYADFFSRRDGLASRAVSAGAELRLRRHGWPGNVRELRNLVQRLLIMGAEGEIDQAEVERALSGAPPGPRRSSDTDIDLSLPLREARERFERDYLEQQLKAAGGSVGRLATLCGMERTHLYRKLRALGLEPGDG